jgi:hypothetical protein
LGPPPLSARTSGCIAKILHRSGASIVQSSDTPLAASAYGKESYGTLA